MRGTTLFTRASNWASARRELHLVKPTAIKIPSEWLAVLAFGSLVCNTLFGTVSVLVFICAIGLLVVSRPGDAARSIVQFLPLLVLPLFACLSTLWSDAPQRTLRAGLQLLLTFVAAILVARNLRAERMLLLLFFAFLVICLTVIPGIPASLSSGEPVSSVYLGSKNQVSFAAHLVGASALAIIIDRNQPMIGRLFAVVSMPLVLLLAYLSRSGGGTTSFLITMTVFPILAIVGRFKLVVRLGLLVIAMMLAGIGLMYATEIEASITDFRVNVLNKDATLTGRTYLWDFANRLSAQKPLFGHGYGAFWREGNLDAEGLWRWGGIANRSGFNFHNAFIGFKVDLGVFGEGALIAFCAVIALVVCYRLLVRPSVPIAFFAALLAVLYLRSLVEDGLAAPFSVITVLWLSALVYALEPAPNSAPSPHSAARNALPPRRAQRGLGRTYSIQQRQAHKD